MAFENITMNLSALENINPPDINISGSNVFSDIIDSANFFTEDYLILGTMFIILIVVYLLLSDKTPLQDFGYDDIRALNIALSTSTLIGLTMVSVGWSNNFLNVGMFASWWLATYVLILIYENRE